MWHVLTLGAILAARAGSSSAEAASLHANRLVVGLTAGVSSVRAEPVIDRAGGRIRRIAVVAIQLEPAN
jgi:hypothetical protein